MTEVAVHRRDHQNPLRQTAKSTLIQLSHGMGVISSHIYVTHNRNGNYEGYRLWDRAVVSKHSSSLCNASGTVSHNQ